MAWCIIGIIPNKTTRTKKFLNVTKLLWLPEEASFPAIPYKQIAIISFLKIRLGTTHNNLIKKMQKIITSSCNPLFLWKLWSDQLGQLNYQSWQQKLIICTNWQIQDKLPAGFYHINQPKINEMETHRRHKSPHPKDLFGENGVLYPTWDISKLVNTIHIVHMNYDSGLISLVQGIQLPDISNQ